jgi:hypothetical protein
MRDHVFPLVAIRQLARILISGFPVQGTGRIFHCPADIVPADDLIIFLPGKIYTCDPGIESDHFRGMAKYPRATGAYSFST